MSQETPADLYAENPSFMERKAAGFLSGRLRGEDSAAGESGVSGLADDRLAAVKLVERRAIALAAISGLVSGSLIGGGEVWLRLYAFGGGIEDLDFRAQLPYWVGFYALVGLITVVEILLLYWNSLTAVSRVVGLSGAPLAEGPHGRLVTRALARAGLEFPNPQQKIYGVDPHALVPGWRITLFNLLYKVKVGITSFLLRILLRRVVARAALRGLIPLLAIPLYAIWNALITWRIARECRLRALGPIAAEAALERLDRLPEGARGPAVRQSLQGLAEIVVLARDGHPNFIFLMSRLQERLADPEDPLEPSWQEACRDLAEAGEEQRQAVLLLLSLAAVSGSRLRRDQKDFLEAAYRACGRQLDRKALIRLRRGVFSGRVPGREEAAALGL